MKMKKVKIFRLVFHLLSVNLRHALALPSSDRAGSFDIWSDDRGNDSDFSTNGNDSVSYGSLEGNSSTARFARG